MVILDILNGTVHQIEPHQGRSGIKYENIDRQIDKKNNLESLLEIRSQKKPISFSAIFGSSSIKYFDFISS